MPKGRDTSRMDKFLGEIKQWQTTYPNDILALRELLLSETPSRRARRVVAAILNYQLQNTDLLPDWMPELGLVDDAIALRTGAALFRLNNVRELPPQQKELLNRLFQQNETVRAIFGRRYNQFYKRVRGFMDKRVHGRTPGDIIGNDTTRRHFLKELDEFVKRYKIPVIEDSGAFVRKFQSYITAKFP